MKITKVDIYMLDATAQRASRRPICCRVWTDEGFYGDGEAGIAFDYAAPAGIGILWVSPVTVISRLRSTCGDRHAPGYLPSGHRKRSYAYR